MHNVVAQLVITMTDDGKVNINGPVENTMLCYGLLQMGTQAVTRYADQAQKKIIEVPPGTVVKP